MKYPFIEIALLISMMGLIVYVIVKLKKNSKISMFNATLSPEELEIHAKKTALAHSISSQRNILHWPLNRVNDHYAYIKSLYIDLNEDIRQKRAVPPAAEWILDNYYVIEEQTKSIRRDLKKKEYASLPVLVKGPFRGYARALAIAMEFVAIVDGQIDEGTLKKYLEAYQSHNILEDREIRFIPMMLQIALLENVRTLCENIKETQQQWNLADEIIDKWWSNTVTNDEKTLMMFQNTLDSKVESHRSFIEHLFYRFRRSGHSYVHILRAINEYLVPYSTSAEQIAQQEHNAQGVTAVSMGNDIMSLKYIVSFNWSELFEQLSYEEQILRQDPGEVYSRMDTQSRGFYLMHIEKLAKRYGVSPRHIAQAAIDLAQNANQLNYETDNDTNEGKRRAHVGYYLMGEGLGILQTQQGKKEKSQFAFLRKIRRIQGQLYIASILTLTMVLIGSGVCYAVVQSPDHEIFLGLLAGIAILIPASEISVSLINWVVGLVKTPAFFPRMELKEGIPRELATMVVVPALLSDLQRVTDLLDHIENHYLANKETHLYFALIGGFKDSQEETSLEDHPILLKAQAGIDALNQKYSPKGATLFYFFHRKNTYNQIDDSWTGWERKRGALMEFNELLLGSTTTSFMTFAKHHKNPPQIKYIITLDADTLLPLGMAKKMVGTMAHPYHIPVIDPVRNVVVEGHGLMQPRVSFDMDSSNKSMFSRIYTEQEGMDPYANAISDVYQDLFDEGIFTGKGIYDLKVFREVLKEVVPENAVLSHDLLEGSYVRAALVSDLELVDAYPTKYNSYMARMYRWIRGDWQLMPWLKHTIRNQKKEPISNPLNYISIWKIGDNLRRSMVSPAILILLILGICVLPGSIFFWVGGAAAVILLPLLVHVLEQFTRHGLGLRDSKRHLSGFFGLKASLVRFGLTTMFLSYEAMVIGNAIVVTLVRVLITRKNMLEWVTSEDAERLQSSSLKSYIKAMLWSSLVGIPLSVYCYFYRVEHLPVALGFTLVWGLAPFVAYGISRGAGAEKELLQEAELEELRGVARKTWRYFEEFANRKNNYLTPDNYQEEPFRGVAYRTSPTNMGLGLMAILTARDFGYLGLDEMLNQIGRTLGTLQKMEKWNGHLYNWYDTRTLEPLRPRYISTVDSGNFVCYLITLYQGMKEYLEKPLVGAASRRGMEDTYVCGGFQPGHSFLAYDQPELSDESISLIHWRKVLLKGVEQTARMEGNKDYWSYHLEQLVKENLRELDRFYPWIQKLDELPVVPFDYELTEKLLEFNILLDSNVPLKHYMSHTLNLMNQGKRILNDSMVPLDDPSGIRNWIQTVITQIELGREQMLFFLPAYQQIAEQIFQFSEATRFAPLYNKKRQLFSIGFNLEDNRMSNSYYDLLASEARQTSFIAIARGEVPAKHWYVLGRSLTVVDGYKGLVSWSGTMFEYLMPLILMKNYKNTLLDETYSFVIKSQKKYGKDRHMPWGASESGFGAMDIHLDYQYKAIGVPWLGLKRGLIEDAVTAPYATCMAFLVSPLDAYHNLQYLKKEGMEGTYGYYEAADYTPERLTKDQTKIIVKSYMAHHQGMSLLSLNNYLNKQVLQKRFSANPYVKAARLLLQEKVPTNIVYTKENKEKIIPFKGTVYSDKGSYRHFFSPNLELPKVHILSNGYYSLMMTDRGSGYSRTKDYGITRWREDVINDNYGQFFYVKNKETGETWTSTFGPMNQEVKDYEVIFTADKIQFKRRNQEIETLTEVIVTSGDYGEVRRIKVKNNGQNPNEIEVTSYSEIILADQKNDEAHRAFSNLFVETEYAPEYEALIAHRRTRTESDLELWVAHMAVVSGDTVGEVQYESDRMQFIGRGHSLADPIAMERDRPLTNTTGTVLDPVFSIRKKVRLLPGQSARISYVTMVAQSKDLLMELLAKYQSIENCDAAFWLAMITSQVETKYLNIKAHEMELYQDMLSDIIFISPLRKKESIGIQKNQKGQASLWPHGISGDRPVVLVKIQRLEDVVILYELLKAHEYWRIKDLHVDLVIVVMEEYNYANPIFALVTDIVEANQGTDFTHIRGDVFILNYSIMGPTDLDLLISIARITFDGSQGSVSQQLEYPEAQLLAPNSMPAIWNLDAEIQMENGKGNALTLEKLEFYNGLGGFQKNYQTYTINLENQEMTPLPWTNVVANEEFGFLITEAGGGYTWCHNSRENKLTPWSNDPVCDQAGECLYIKDESNAIWTITPGPLRDTASYQVDHGFGYTSFSHTNHGIEHNMIQFVPLEGKAKISLVTLTNLGNQPRTLSLTYYVEPVLGVSRKDTALHLVSEMGEGGILLIRNGYQQEFPGERLYLDASIPVESHTGNRRDFYGNQKIPQELLCQHLSNQTGAGMDACGAIQVTMVIPPRDQAELVFVMGLADQGELPFEESRRYRTVALAKEELNRVKDFWKNKTGILQVNTPDQAMNQMLNGRLYYQVIACRMWARSAFYQSGGAYGFRDQLQDSLALLTIWPELTRKQILKHARHEFLEGDVLHWWHEPGLKGTRTRISDDYLWLPYVVAEYLKTTGDYAILQEQLPYLECEVLRDYEEERYVSPNVTQQEGSLYEHCIKAIEHGLRYGEHGLPLMGTGDWNDGMNRVGNLGKGESIWLGWFLSTILKQWIPICENCGEQQRSREYFSQNVNLTEALETHGWDGSWYKRAYCDNKEQLGASHNSQCKIDSLAQSWAVLSESGNSERCKIAMASLEDYLINRREGIIRLLTPPFDHGDLDPGYIKGYVPGVRENGGQYTHAAAWVVAAFGKMGMGDKAFELFSLINPIHHGRTNTEVGIYKVEPYVMSADVYGCAPHVGRGGWSWYTGAASWMLQAGLQSILGFHKEGNNLTIAPCIPEKWQEFSMKYEFESTLYDIHVSNPEGISQGRTTVIVNGTLQQDQMIHLEGGLKPQTVVVLMHQEPDVRSLQS